jgi:hypothetical protein
VTYEEHQQILDVAEVAENSSFGAVPLESVWSQVIRRRPDTSEEIFEEAIKLLLKKGNLHPDFCSLENFRTRLNASTRGTAKKAIKKGDFPLLDRLVEAPDHTLQTVLQSFSCSQHGADPRAVEAYFNEYRRLHPYKAAHEPYSRVTFIDVPPQPKSTDAPQKGETIVARGLTAYARWQAAGAGRMARFEARSHSAKCDPILAEHWYSICARDMELTGCVPDVAIGRLLASRMSQSTLELIGCVASRLMELESRPR